MFADLNGLVAEWLGMATPKTSMLHLDKGIRLTC